MADIERNPWCGTYPCQGKVTGQCAMAEHVFLQAENRGWTPKAWKNFLSRVERDVIPHCEYPDKLRRSIEEAEPNYTRR